MKNTKPGSFIGHRDVATGYTASLSDCHTEDEVVIALITSGLELGADSSRYYDAYSCSIRNLSFVALRKASKGYKHLDEELVIFDTTYDNSAEKLDGVFFENYAQVSKSGSKEKLNWVTQLELEGKGWYDIPVLDQGKIIGLWVIDSTKYRNKPTKAVEQSLMTLATLAGQKISLIRAIERAEIGQKFQLIVSRNKSVKGGEAVSEVVSALDAIGEIMNAAFVAYFKFDMTQDALVKEFEVQFDDGPSHYRKFNSDADKKYKLDEEYLTPRAFGGDLRLQLVSDFNAIRVLLPNFVNSDSDAAHSAILPHGIQSAVFCNVTLASGRTGLIRCLGERRSSHRRFGTHHLTKLQQLGVLFAHIQSVSEHGQFLRETSEMFRSALTYARTDKDDPVLRLTKLSTEFRNILIVCLEGGKPPRIASVDGLRDGRVRSLENTAQNLPSSAVELPVGIVSTSTFPSWLLKYIPKGQLAYVVKQADEAAGFFDHETLFCIFVVGFDTDLQRNFWKDSRSLCDELELVGRIVCISREMARNHSFVTRIEQVISGIGHEMKFPVSGLRSRALQLSRVIDDISTHIDPRTPLNIEVNETTALSGSTSSIRILSTVGEARDWALKMKPEVSSIGRRLDRIIDNSLNWGRLSGNVTELDFERVPIRDLFRAALNAVGDERARRPWLRVGLEKALNSQVVVIGDRHYLEMLTINLLDNAIKYSHSRSGRSRNGTSRHRAEVIVKIEDQDSLVDIFFENWGQGIIAEELPFVTQPFFRSRIRDQHHKVDGVGLGLALCNRVAEMHKATFKIESNPSLDDKKRTKQAEGYTTIVSFRMRKDLPIGRTNFYN
jgi:signal transduction histidine kinase